MINQKRKPFLNRLLICVDSLRVNRCLLKIGRVALLVFLSSLADAHASNRSLQDDSLFYEAHPTLRESPREILTRIEYLDPVESLERQQAHKVICGVVAMYRENINFSEGISYNLRLGDYISKVNASYTLATRSFYLPRVHTYKGEPILTACDQGIVSHESGHMILFDIGISNETSHKGALHEAFGDLTAHFYRFYNQETRASSLYMLENNTGCVGDHNFTCVRNSSHPLTLGQVSCEVHDLSRPLSSAVYHNMVNAFKNREANSIDDYVAGEIMEWHKGMFINAVTSLRTFTPTLMDVAKRMLDVSCFNRKYRNGLGESFIRNGLITIMYHNPTPCIPFTTREYVPNETFATLCIAKKAPIITRIPVRRW